MKNASTPDDYKPVIALMLDRMTYYTDLNINVSCVNNSQASIRSLVILCLNLFYSFSCRNDACDYNNGYFWLKLATCTTFNVVADIEWSATSNSSSRVLIFVQALKLCDCGKDTLWKVVRFWKCLLHISFNF